MGGDNLLFRLILDANSFDKNMASAQKSVQGFIQKNASLGSVMGTVGKAMGAFGAAVGVAGGALAAAQKTIAATQTATDAFGRAMEGAKSAVDSFFYSLSTGNFDGFLSGLKDTIKYARQAYDALDDLGTFQIFAGAQNAEIKQQREDLKAQIKTGYRYTVDDAGNVSRIKLSDQEIAEAKEKLREVQAEYIKLIKETVEKEEVAYKAVARDILKKKKFAGGEAEMDAAVAYYLANYKNYGEADTRYKEIQAKIAAGTRREMQYNQISGAMELTNVYTPEASRLMNSAELKNLRALLEIGDEDLKNLLSHRVAGVMAKATLSGELRADEKVFGKEAAAKAEKPKADTKLSGPEAWLLFQGEQFLKELEEPLEDLTAWTDEATQKMTFSWEKYFEELRQKSEEASELIGGLSGMYAEFGNVVGGVAGDNIAAIGKFIDAAKGMVPVIEALVAQQKLEEAQSLANTGAKLGEAAAGGANAVANIPYAGPALAIAAITSILGMAGAIKSLKFAEGGVVPGNNYTDGIQAKVSAGEVVLNSHDAKNLYDQIHSGNLGGGGGVGYVSGEMIYIGLNNYLKRSGKGQIVVKS